MEPLMPIFFFLVCDLFNREQQTNLDLKASEL